MRDASVQLVTIVGEPGVGKSRLVAELFDLHRRHARAHHLAPGRCLPYGEGITFWALGEIVKAQAGILESDAPEMVAAKLERGRARGRADREWLRHASRPSSGSRRAGGAEESFTAWRRFFEALAADGPAVLVFEDLHWADEALLDFLEHLADWSKACRCCWSAPPGRSCTSASPTGPAGSGTRPRSTSRPLTDEETARLVSVCSSRRRCRPRCRRCWSSAPAATRCTRRSSCAC